MNFIPLTLKGISPRADHGHLVITRRVLDDVISSIIDTSAMDKNPMEQGAILPPGTWQGAFWFPGGDGSKSTKDITEFFTWVVHVREDLVEYVQAACQPRYLKKVTEVPAQTLSREIGLSA